MKNMFLLMVGHDVYFQRTKDSKSLFVRCGRSADQNRFCAIPEGISVYYDIDDLMAEYQKINPMPQNNLFFDEWENAFQKWRFENVLTTAEFYELVKNDLRKTL